MDAPKWFLRELKLIDPRYFPFFNEEYDYWEIRHHVVYSVTDDAGRIERREMDPTLAVFKHLNDAALDDLRRRKRIGEKFARIDQKLANKAYLKWINDMSKESAKKGRELGIEMQAKGWMQIFKHLRGTQNHSVNIHRPEERKI